MDILKRLGQAEEFLLAGQTANGLWPDFELLPGLSESWITAIVGMALARPPFRLKSTPSVLRAASILHEMSTKDGWGFNRKTASDADTTAWVLQLLTHIDDLRGINGVLLLKRFLDVEGGSHTFVGSKFGRWTGEHADVSPTVGLALIRLSADRAIVEKVREKSLGAFVGIPPWRSFWWTTDTYAVAANLEFLEASGGVPAQVITAVGEWANGLKPSCTLGVAQLLNCALLAARAAAPEYAKQLLDLQNPDGSWPSSDALIVPSQRGQEDFDIFGDSRSLFSTAMGLMALKRYCVATAAVSF